MEEMVEITKSRLLDLLRSERELIALDAAGVDNWIGYEMIDWGEIHEGHEE